jgi:uncharacterized protein DUF3592
MGLRNLFRRDKGDPEAARRTRLRREGRIADGSILDVGTDEAGNVTHVFYTYDINGVEYESSQSLDAEQLTRRTDYYAGAHCTVRFDPHQPANSVVV